MCHRLCAVVVLAIAAAPVIASSIVEVATIPPGHIPAGKYVVHTAVDTADIQDRDTITIAYHRGVVCIYNANGDLRLIGRQTPRGIFAEYVDAYGDCTSLVLTAHPDGGRGFIDGSWCYEHGSCLLLLPIASLPEN